MLRDSYDYIVSSFQWSSFYCNLLLWTLGTKVEMIRSLMVFWRKGVQINSIVPALWVCTSHTEVIMVTLRIGSQTDISQWVIPMGKIKEKRSIQRRLNLRIPNKSPINEVLTRDKTCSVKDNYTSSWFWRKVLIANATAWGQWLDGSSWVNVHIRETKLLHYIQKIIQSICFDFKVLRIRVWSPINSRQ